MSAFKPGARGSFCHGKATIARQPSFLKATMYTRRPILAPGFISNAATAFFACLALCTLSTSADAGVPECRNIRLEDLSANSCEVRGSVRCSAGCDQLGVYEKACATRLHTVCREECTLSPEQDCTDECTVECTDQCDAGVNITCTHNCFLECQGSCEEQCQGAEDEGRCRASCEATCDGECDIQCAPLINASCYEHCIECCDGSCQARANMDCQTTCQDQEFRDCEYEFRAECDASCEAEGALFCDGEYILAGGELLSCAQALIKRGSLQVEAQADGEASFDLTNLTNSNASSGGCSMQPQGGAQSAGWSLFGLGLLLGGLRRRRPSP